MVHPEFYACNGLGARLEEVETEIVHSGVGSISESDATLASASDAVILGFHAKIDTGVADVTKREGVQIKLYAIIYELIEYVSDFE